MSTSSHDKNPIAAFIEKFTGEQKDDISRIAANSPKPVTNAATSTGALTALTALTVEQYATAYTSRWGRSNAEKLEAYTFLADANKTLDARGKGELIKKIGVSRPQFVKAAKVGDDRRLRDAKILPLLPDVVSTLYGLTTLNDEEIAAAMSSGIICPALKRRALERWIASHRGHKRGVPRIVETAPDVELQFPNELSIEDRSDVDEALERFSGIGIQITYPKAEADDRKAERWAQIVSTQMRSRALRLIRQSKKQSLKGKPRDIIKSDWQRRRWPFAAADLEIAPGADDDRIRQVLSHIGRGDEFEKIRDEAYRFVRQRRRSDEATPTII